MKNGFNMKVSAADGEFRRPWYRFARRTHALEVFGISIPLERTFATIAVLGLHLIFLWILFHKTPVDPQPPGTAAFQVTLVQLGQPQRETPPAKPNFVAPSVQETAPPEITIESEERPDSGPIGGTDAMLLPPRPDLAHPNRTPPVPAELKSVAASATVMLRILVTPEGSIKNAQVERTSGNESLDQLALSFVEQNWRLKPALLGASPTQAWTSVLVHFTTDI